MEHILKLTPLQADLLEAVLGNEIMGNPDLTDEEQEKASNEILDLVWGKI